MSNATTQIPSVRFTNSQNVIVHTLSFLTGKELMQGETFTICKALNNAAVRTHTAVIARTQAIESLAFCQNDFSHKLKVNFQSPLEIFKYTPCLTRLVIDKASPQELEGILASTTATKLTSLGIGIPDTLCITDKVLQEIPQRCPNLTELDLRDSSIATYKGIPYLQNLKNLKKLSLCRFTRIRHIASTLTQMPTLTDINLSGCKSIETSDVAVLLRGMPNLSAFGVGGEITEGICSEPDASEVAKYVAGQNAWAIKRNGKNLTSIDLSNGYYHLSDIDYIISGCPKLTSLDMTNMVQIGPYHLEKLAENLGKTKANLKVLGLQPPAEQKKE